jgi:hypothetical protein
MRLARVFQAIGDLVDGSLGSVRSVCIADLEFSSAILLRARADLCQENEAAHITGQSDPHTGPCDAYGSDEQPRPR